MAPRRRAAVVRRGFWRRSSLGVAQRAEQLRELLLGLDAFATTFSSNRASRRWCGDLCGSLFSDMRATKARHLERINRERWR